MNNHDDNSFTGFEENSSSGYHENGQKLPNEPSDLGKSSFSGFEADLPKLGSGSSMGLNKKGLFFLAAVGLIGMFLAIIAYKKVFQGSDNEAKQEKEEEIVIPERDFNTLPPPAVAEEELPSGLSENMIASEPMAIPLVETENKSFAPSVPLSVPLASRRVGDSGSVINNGSGGGSVDGMPGFGGNIANAGLNNNIQDEGNIATATVTKNVRRINNMDTLLIRGTYIRCVLETRIVSELSGPTSCVVTSPVYSASGRNLLIEKGSRVFGEYQGDDNGVNSRVAILWTRVLTPTGKDIQLNSPGIDNLGGVGHPGKFSSHWGSRLAAAVLVSMTADVFNYASVKYGPKTTRTTVDSSTGAVTTVEEPFDSKTVEALSKMPEQILSKTLNRPATVTINQGNLINIYTIKDIDFAPVLD